jgi:hypothetical protein
VENEFHVAVADCLRGHVRTANTSAACGFDGRDCSGGRIFLPAAGIIKFGCHCGAIEYETRGKHFSLDEVQGEFLWPEIPPADPSAAAKNSDSLVLKLKYRNRTLLLPGDAEKQAEHTMLKENSAVLHADVLKVGHHGSKNSTKPEFLDAVAPAIAIISSGEDNPYGHPSPELLKRLEASGARVLRTDRDGAVHIVTDGDRLEISCFVACPELSTVTTSRRAETPNQNQNNQQ